MTNGEQTTYFTDITGVCHIIDTIVQLYCGPRT